METWLFVIILIDAVAARFYGIDRLGLWSDEIWGVSESSQRTLFGMFEYVRNFESHPPGHYLLLRITQSVLGDSAFAVRLPSALFGIATVIIMYHLGCRYFSKEAGLISSAWLAGDFQSIYFCQQARANIIVSFFILLATHVLYQIVSGGERTKSKYIYFWISATIACYLHYAGLVFIFCQGIIALVILLWKEENKLAQTKVFIKLYLPVLVFQIPWLSGLYHQLTNGPIEEWQTAPDSQTIKGTILFLASYDTLNFLTCLVMYAGFFCYLLWLISRKIIYARTSGLVDSDKAKITFLLYLIFLIIVPVAFFYIKSDISQPVYNSRHFIYIIPLALFLIAYLFSLLIFLLPSKIQPFFLACLLGLIIIYQNYFNISHGLYSKDVNFEDYRGAVQVIASDIKFRQQESKAIISSTPFFDHYLKRLNGVSSDFIFSDADQIDMVKTYLEERQIKQFYYLGATDLYVMRINDVERDGRLMELTKYYHPVCRSKLHRAHVVKFIGLAAGEIDYSALPLCPFG